MAEECVMECKEVLQSYNFSLNDYLVAFCNSLSIQQSKKAFVTNTAQISSCNYVTFQNYNTVNKEAQVFSMLCEEVNL